MAQAEAMNEEAREDNEAFVPIYVHWILAMGCAAIVISVLVIAVLVDLIKLPWSFSNRNLAAAYILAVLASFNMMVMNSVAHGLSPAGQEHKVGMSWNEAFFWRSIFLLTLASPYLISPSLFSFLKLDNGKLREGDGDGVLADEHTPLRDNKTSLFVSSTVWMHYLMLVLRSMLGVLSGILVCAGVSYLPQSEAVALYATAPFWSILFSYLLLGEVLGGLVILCMVACFGGALMILQPWAVLNPAPIHIAVVVACTLCLLAGAIVGLVGQFSLL